MSKTVWICRCGHLNFATDARCKRCGFARAVAERRQRDLSKVVAPTPAERKGRGSTR